MAIRSDEITSIIKSAIDSFDAGVETRSVGTVVEVGDGIAQIYGLDGALASEMLEFPGGVMGMALNLEEETVGAVILGDATAIKEGDTVKTTGRVVEVPVGQALLGRVVDPLGRPLDDKGPIAATDDPPGRAHRPRRHRPQVGRHAGPDRHQGHRRADPDRPRPARADHRRPPDRQDRHRHRHDHQPEGQGPRLHLRGHRPEALDGRQDRRRSSSSTARWSTPSSSSPAPRIPPRSSTSPRTPAWRWARRSWRTASRSTARAGQGRAVRLRRPDQARLGVPRDGAAAAPPARPRGLPGRRLLPPQPPARARRAPQRGERRRLADGAADHRDAGRRRVGLHPDQRHLDHRRPDLPRDGPVQRRPAARAEHRHLGLARRLGGPDQGDEEGRRRRSSSTSPSTARWPRSPSSRPTWTRPPATS